MFGPKIKETTTITGTAQSGFGNGDIAGYHCENASDPSEWEEGFGVLDTGAGTLTRNLLSSSTGSKINWASGTKYIYCVPLAQILKSLLASNAGTSRPGWLPGKGLWIDTTSSPWVLKCYDGSDDIAVGQIDPTANTFRAYAGAALAISGTLAAALNAAKGSAVASATTTNIWASDGNTIHVTGTATITGLGTAPQAGATRRVVADGAFTLTNGANLICPGGADITAAAGDVFEVLAETTTQHRITSYTKADGTAVTAPEGISASSTTALTSGTSKDFAIPPGAKRLTLIVSDLSTNGTSNPLVQLGDSGGIETAGYATGSASLSHGSNVAVITSVTNGFSLAYSSTAAANSFHGIIELFLVDPATNTWVAVGGDSYEDLALTRLVHGSKSLTGEATTLRLTISNGTDAFDGGKARLFAE